MITILRPSLLSFLCLLWLPALFLLADTATAASISPFLNPKVEVVELDQHVQRTRKTLKDLKKQAILLQQQNRRQLQAGTMDSTESESNSSDDVDLAPQPDSEDMPFAASASAALRKGSKQSGNGGKSSSNDSKDSKKSSKKTSKNSKAANKRGKESKVLKYAKKKKSDSSMNDGCPCPENLDSEDVPIMCDCDGSYDERSHNGSSHDDEEEGENMGRRRGEYEFVMVRNAVGTPSPEEEYGLNSSIGLNGLIFEMAYVNKPDGSQERTWGDETIGYFNGVCTVVSEDPELLCKYDFHLYTHGPNQYAGFIVSTPITTSADDVGIVTGTAFDFSEFSGGSLTTYQDEEEPILFAYLSLE